MPDIHTPGGSPAPDDASPRTREVSPFGKGRFGKWFDNFWYHYNFHTIAALILTVAVIICAVQCATRAPTPDLVICYAGACDLRPSSKNTVSEDLTAALTPAAAIAVGEEEPRISVNHYLIRTDLTDSAAINLSRTNMQNLRDELAAANGYLFILDKALFDEFGTTAGGDHYMTELAPYLPADSGSLRLTEDGRGVYIHSTPLGSLPGVCDLPEDAILCLRVSFSVSSMMGADTAATYALCERFLRACLAPPQ